MIFLGKINDYEYMQTVSMPARGLPVEQLAYHYYVLLLHC